jgi:lipoxygenase homology domain-containing protein 1
VPWAAPTHDNLADILTLEDKMHATLSELASFNETERMILIKQFSFQEKTAHEQARLQNLRIYSPPGLLSLGQFIAAWHNLSVNVSRPQAQTLFYKYGCDCEGLLPYEVFAMRLLSCPARMLALEPEMAGPWPAGGFQSWCLRVLGAYPWCTQLCGSASQSPILQDKSSTTE